MRLPLASIAGPTANKASLLVVTVLVSVWLFSSAPPPSSIVAKLEIVLSPESSKTVSLAVDSESVGASFTAVTFRVKVWVVESVPPASSLSTNVTVAVPLALAAGV